MPSRAIRAKALANIADPLMTTRFQAATMFTIYLTTANIGRVVGNWLVGVLREQLGFSYEQTFAFAGTAVILPLFLLLLVRPEDVDRARKG